MRMDFDANVPRADQLIRAAKRKQVGRKHNHTVGPGRARKPGADPRLLAARRKYREQVALYFAGGRDTMPAKPGGAA